MQEKIGEIQGLVKIYAEKFDSGEVKYVINRYIPSCIYPFMEPLGEGLAHEIRAVVVTGNKGIIGYEVFNRNLANKRMFVPSECFTWLDFAREVCGENFIKRGVC